MGWRMTGLTRAALLSVAFAIPTAASAVVIGFDDLDASLGQPIPLTQITEAGYTFGVSSGGTNLGAAIFDTTCAVYVGCNGDPDLQPGGGQGADGISGNVLILQDEVAGRVTPSDSAGFEGRAIFTLVSGTPFRFEGFSAVDDGTYTAFGPDGTTELGSLSLPADNSTGSVSFSSPVIGTGDSFAIRYSDSGGVDSLQLAPIPVPAALPLSLAAFGALGWIARRRRTA